MQIMVVRIICVNNREKRKQTKEALQYTLTVLPAALIPHSRIPVNVIFNTYTDYLNGKLSNQYAAALAIFCESRHSFRLYYARIRAKQYNWSIFLLELQEPDEALPQPLAEHWSGLLFVMKAVAHPLHSNWWQAYCHTILCSNGMGLGP